jgi:hypothetical protein
VASAAAVETAAVKTAAAMCCLGGLRLGQDEDACQSGCRKAQAACYVDALHVAYSFFARLPYRRLYKRIGTHRCTPLAAR